MGTRLRAALEARPALGAVVNDWPIVTGSTNATAHGAARATIADSAVADYSRDPGGKVAVMRADAHRDDPDMTGHRPTELSLGIGGVRDAA